MKNLYLCTILSLLVAGNISADYEDNKKVRALAAGGNPVLIRNSAECPKSYDDQSFTTQLGEAELYSTHCVGQVRIPRDVLKEILLMEKNQLENESDSDSRVTKLYVLKQSTFRMSMSDKQSKKLFTRLGVPEDQMIGFRYSTFIGDEESFGELNYLTVGLESSRDTAILRYLRSLAKGKLVFKIETGDGISLYPGGGFAVEYDVYLLDGLMIYVKRALWKS